MQTSSAASRVQANLQELFKSKLTPGNAYVKFRLTSEITALLSMNQVQESLIVNAENITSLPNMPKSTIGMMNKSDRVFCVFDLAQLLNLSSWSIPPRQYQIIVLQTFQKPSIYLGLAVSELQGIARLSVDQIQPSMNSFSEYLTTFLSGVTKENNNLIPILDFNSILRSLIVK